MATAVIVTSDNRVPIQMFVSSSLGFQAITPVDKGGTGQTSYTNGQLLIGNATGNTLTKATLTEGEGIDIVNGTGSITIKGEDATITNKGIASFVTADFTVSSGAVTIKNATTTTKGKASFATADFTVSSGAVTIKDSGIDHNQTTNFVAGEHFLQSAITEVGTVTTGNVTAVVTDATTSAKGKAKFNTANFAVTSGDVTIKDGGVAIVEGGTGQTTQTAGYDALSPTTTKGDVVVNDGANNIRLGVGSNSTVLTADSAVAGGVKWTAAPGAGATILSAYKTADETVNASSTFQDDDHLSFTVDASTNYIVELVLIGSQISTSPDFKAQFILPSHDGTTTYLNTLCSTGSIATFQTFNDDVTGTTVFFTSGLTNCMGDNTGNNMLRTNGVVTIGGTGGTFKLQWAQNTLTASDTILRVGSYLKLTKI